MVVRRRYLIARKRYRCDVCLSAIETDEPYLRDDALSDGTQVCLRSCAACVDQLLKSLISGAGAEDADG